ncbi:zinc-dependent metalloprotease [uncultured Algibacter sp.]|uniref:zinc-dependent metalloprotease n=1 Tax=uncultured Algibacter sp. TaxID=298659 RepID=UPI0026102D9A|nr:zinc-dependent metalloprotease [uncultured Algibacter sp.]
MKLLTKITILISFLITSILTAQNKDEMGCDTSISAESISRLKSLKPALKELEKDFNSKKYSKNSRSSKFIHQIPIKAHVIRSSESAGGLNISDLNDAIKRLNSIYSEALISFYLFENIDFIDNSEYVHFKKGDEEKLTKADYTSGIINIYFVDYIENNSGNSICGYSVNKQNCHMIVMKNECTSNNSSLIHEMGHVFSLIHTHGISNTKITAELVNGSNCDTEGDGICDTPADPGLSSDKIDNFCNYNGNELDSNGDEFSPDTENFMSYSKKACRNHFTPQQLARMYAYFNIEKNEFTQTENGIEIREDNSVTNSLNSVSIYPNPIRDNTIYLKGFDNLSRLYFKVINLQGQLLLSGKALNNRIRINTLSSGSYFLLLETVDSKTVKRFIK